MKIVAYVLLIFIVHVGARPSWAQRLPITTTSEEAREHFLQGQTNAFHWQAAAAREHLDAAIVADSTFVLAYLHRAGTGSAASEIEHYMELAERHRGRASESEGLMIDAFRAFLIDRDYDGAIRILQGLSEEYPDDPYLPGYLGMRYYNHFRNYGEAARQFEQALERDSTFVPAHQLLGWALMNQEDYVAAELHFMDNLRLAPGQWRPYVSLGTLFARQGRFAEADPYFEQGGDRDPSGSARNLVGYLYLRAGRYEEAERFFRDNVRQHPSDPGTYDSLGDLYLAMDRYNEAAEQFEQALARDPHFTLSRDNLARTRIEQANVHFEVAFGEQDATALAALYTEDGQLLPAGSGIVEGTVAIERFWQGAFAAGLSGAELETLEVYLGAGGETATEVGRYRLNAGDQEADAGKYVVVWSRTSEGWKLHRDMWTTDRESGE